MCRVGQGQRRRLRRHERGQSIVELALVLPVLLVLALGAADLARLFSVEVGIANAAREGASYSSHHPTDPVSTVQRHVLAEFGQAAICDGANEITGITLRQRHAPNPPGGSEVAVTVSYRFVLNTPVPMGWTTITITRTADMLVI